MLSFTVFIYFSFNRFYVVYIIVLLIHNQIQIAVYLCYTLYIYIKSDVYSWNITKR